MTEEIEDHNLVNDTCKIVDHEHIDVLSYFLNPFINNMNNLEGVEYSEEELIEELKNLYSAPTFCIGCHINAYKLSIIDNLEADQNYNKICTDIIIPTIKDILDFNLVDTTLIEIETMEEWNLAQEKKPKPASLEIIEEFKKKPLEIIDNHDCFCGEEDNNNIIKLDCCKNYVHLDCILKWFENNNTCPYCRKKYE